MVEKQELARKLLKYDVTAAAEFVIAELSSRTYKALSEIFKKMSRKELYSVIDHELLHCVDEAEIKDVVSRLGKRYPGYFINKAEGNLSSNPTTDQSMPRALDIAQKENIMKQIEKMVEKGLTREGILQQLISTHKLPTDTAEEIYELAQVLVGE